jgi:hypothetical protein
MKKVCAFVAFAMISLATTSAHAQSTISPVPGAPDRPHEPTPTTGSLDKVSGQQRSDGQMMSTTPSGSSTMAGKKAARKEMKMQKKATKAGSK